MNSIDLVRLILRRQIIPWYTAWSTRSTIPPQINPQVPSVVTIVYIDPHPTRNKWLDTILSQPATRMSSLRHTRQRTLICIQWICNEVGEWFLQRVERWLLPEAWLERQSPWSTGSKRGGKDSLDPIPYTFGPHESVRSDSFVNGRIRKRTNSLFMHEPYVFNYFYEICCRSQKRYLTLTCA